MLNFCDDHYKLDDESVNDTMSELKLCDDTLISNPDQQDSCCISDVDKTKSNIEDDSCINLFDSPSVDSLSDTETTLSQDESTLLLDNRNMTNCNLNKQNIEEDSNNKSPKKYTTSNVNYFETVLGHLESSALTNIMNEPDNTVNENFKSGMHKSPKLNILTKDDEIQKLVHYVNEIYDELKFVKKELAYLKNSVTELINPEKRNDYLEFKANTNGRLLGQEIKIEKLEKDKVPNLAKIENDIRVNNTNIKKHETFLRKSDVSLNNMKNQLEGLQGMVTAINTNRTHFPTVRHENEISTEQHDNELTIFDHDVLYFVDSNLKNMKADIMKNGVTGLRLMTYKLEQIHDVISNATIVRHPQKIFVHCGTNHLDYRVHSTTELEDEYIKTLELLEEKFPTTEIIISSLLPRKEGSVNRLVRQFNDFLDGISSTALNVRYMRNHNVARSMLTGQRHINEKGFSILLSNIRFTLFNNAPKSMKSRKMGR